MSLTIQGLESFAKHLAKLNGLDADTAADYASRIGDTPQMAADGRVVVLDDSGKQIAAVRLQ